MADLSDLLTPESAEEIEQRLLDLAEEEELPTTGWGPGSWIPTVLKLFADALGDAWEAIRVIANGGILELSEGAWLDILAVSQYDDARLTATFNTGTFRLTDSGGGPHTITAGALIITTQAGLRYRNTTGGTLALDGTLDVSVIAETPGAQYNIPNESSLTLTTSLPSVTVSNPAVGVTGTWITTLGSDAETDANLRTRLRAKWGLLSTGSPVSAYEYKALSQTGVTRVKIDDGNPDGPGTIRVYIDNASAVSALQTALDAWVPIGTRATATAATAQAVTITGTVTVARAYRSTAESAASANLTTLANRIPIGGRVILAQVYEAIMSALPDDNISSYDEGSAWAGTPDVTLGASSYPAFTLALTWVEA